MAETHMKPEDVRPSEAQRVLAFLNAAKTAEEIAEAIEILGERDVGLRVAQLILERRQELGGFRDLKQVADVPQIGPERFTEVVTTLATKKVTELSTIEPERARFRALLIKKPPLSDLKGVDKKSLESLKKAGVETLEDLKSVDMPQLCKRTGLSEALLREILLRAELQAYRVPTNVADALAASGAIARAGELAAFDAEAIQALLAKRAKPRETMDLSIEAIEALKAHVPRLTLDEETTQGVSLEETTTPLLDETEPALRAEEPVVSKREAKAISAELESTLQRFSDRIRAIVTAPEETVEFANVQALIASLQADIRTASATVMGKLEPIPGITMGEDEAPALADEEIELDVQIQALSQKLVATQEQLAALQMRRITGDEELSPTAAEEEEPTGLRGE